MTFCGIWGKRSKNPKKPHRSRKHQPWLEQMSLSQAATAYSARLSVRRTKDRAERNGRRGRTQLGGTAYDRLRILTTCRTIAMVGLSANPYHPSDFAAIYLAANGYKIIPINPSQAGKTILGERVYSRIDEIDHPVDIVDVFRPSVEVPEIARQAVKIKAKVLWLQLGIISEDGGKIARDGGLEVVMDRCCKIEHARFFGGLRTIGLNTGGITSRLALKIPV